MAEERTAIEGSTYAAAREQLHGRVLTGAELLVMRSGIRNLRMQDVAAHLAISKKTIYRCFGSKNDLVEAVISRVLQRAESEFGAIRGDAGRTTVWQLQATFEVARSVFRKIGHRMLEDLAHTHHELWRRIDARRREILHTHFAELIAGGVRRGEIQPDLDIEIATAVIARAATKIVAPEELIDLPYSTEEVFDALTSMLFAGILTDRGRAEFRRSRRARPGE